jgi:hypothetical protein
MAGVRSTGTIMKAGVIFAAVIVVLRIILEHIGAPQTLDMVFGVAWLYFLLPICFALRIASSGEAKPFLGLFKDVLLFSIYTRIMVMVTYVIAYFFKWTAPRFSVAQGGNVGENVSFVNGVLIVPLRNAVFWVILASAVGMIIGSVTLALARKKPAPPTAA